MNHRFKKQIKDIHKAKYDLADAAYKTMYDQPSRTRMNKLPEGWLPTRRGFNISVYGKSSFMQFEEHEGRRFTHKDYDQYRIDINSEDFVKKWEAYTRDDIALDELKATTKGNILGMLNSCSTTEVLIKKWPECKKFVPAEAMTVSTTTALAIPISQLNQMLGLP